MQRKEIHVGMTTKVQIDIKQKPTVTVPVNAISCKQGQTMVTVVDGQSLKEVAVRTGKTTASNIEILQGLRAGVKVVVHAKPIGLCL